MITWKKLWQRIRAMEWRDYILLLAAATVCGSILVFAKITDEVMEGELHEAERTLMQSLRQPDDLSIPVGPRWLRYVSLDITALGGVAVLTLMTTLVAGYLLLERRYHAVVLLLVAAIGGMLLNHLLKSVFARDRPDIIPHLADVSSASYPSGHSMISSIIYLTLGVMLAQSVKSRRLKVYFVSAALLLSFLIGLTRIYLGVHYPTDVVAGWAAGTGYAVLCSVVAYWLKKRGVVEPETPSRH